jgi:DNA topoisomerase 2-associated protein PAT1
MSFFLCRNTTGESFVNNKEDEFSGLMTLRERQWIVNIQLNQLKCENPFLDDYYYTIFNQKRNASEQDTKSDTKIMYDETKEVKNKLNIEEVQADRYTLAFLGIAIFHI